MQKKIIIHSFWSTFVKDLERKFSCKIYKKPHENSKNVFFCCTNAKVHEVTKMLYKCKINNYQKIVEKDIYYNIITIKWGESTRILNQKKWPTLLLVRDSSVV
jgi:hypothetical protein